MHFIWTLALSLGALLPLNSFRQAAFAPTTSFQQIRAVATKWGGGRGFEGIPPSPRVPLG